MVEIKLLKPKRLDITESRISIPIDSGYDNGYKEGYDIGSTEGYGKGKSEGLEQGMTLGKSLGYAQATEENSIANAKILSNCNVALNSKLVEGAETLEQVPMRIGEIEVGSGVGYDEGYDDGKQAEHNSFWDSYQDNGNRTNYDSAFCRGWTADNFKPKYNIILGSGETAKGMFNQSTINADLEEICEKQGIIIDFSLVTRLEYTFYATEFTRLGVIDARNATITTNAFAYSYKLKTIDKLIVAETTGFAGTMFANCTELEFIGVEGVIKSNVKISQSPNLNNACIQAFADHFADMTGQTALTFTIHSSVGNRMTEEQKATFTAKNVTLVY